MLYYGPYLITPFEPPWPAFVTQMDVHPPPAPQTPAGPGLPYGVPAAGCTKLTILIMSFIH